MPRLYQPFNLDTEAVESGEGDSILGHDDAADGPWRFTDQLRDDLTELRELFVVIDSKTGRLKGWSDQELGSRAGMTKQAIQLIMSGKTRSLSAESLAGICRAFAPYLPPSYFFSDTVKARVRARLQRRKRDLERQYLRARGSAQ